MKEEYLHYIWKFGLFDLSQLRTSEEENIEIINKGILNHNAGPDFLNAKIRIGETTWVGNIEIHIKASDWNKHLHQNDPAYDNVILHVVLLDDKEIQNSQGHKFPTLSLSSRINNDHFEHYKRLVKSKNSIPCENSIDQIDPFIVSSMKERAVASRLERKTESHLELLKRTGNDWQQLLYKMLASNFGFKINRDPFEELAERTSLKTIVKHVNYPLQVEALLFGQAGFLGSDLVDQYPNDLKKEYEFLRTKYSLNSVDRSNWKFMRMRPANFPTIRLAQFAALLIKTNGLSKFDFRSLNIEDWRDLFSLQVNQYWDDHYRFDESSKKIKKNFGEASFQNIIINTISHFLFAQGIYLDQEELKARAMELLINTKAETNHIISKWKELGINSENSWDTQALIELKNEWCDKKRCLNCHIGVRVIKTQTSVK